MLLGDAGVGKSVMAGVLAKNSAAEGNLAAAYFCRDRDDTIAEGPSLVNFANVMLSIVTLWEGRVASESF